MSRIEPQTDLERIIERIRSGDLRCGSNAARELAVEAEDAYGDAFIGSPADVLRRQALAKGVILRSNTQHDKES